MTDMLAVDCSCGKRIAVPAGYAGKKVSCSACRAVVQVSPQTPPQLPSPASPQPLAPSVAKADERNRAEQSTRAPSSSFQASPPEPPLAPAMNRNSLAISSAIGGFIGLASIPLKLPFVAILAAVAAIALGIFGLKSGGRMWAIIGIVCGCLTLLFIVAAVALVFYEYQRYQQELDSLLR